MTCHTTFPQGGYHLNESIPALLRLLPFPAVYAAPAPIRSPLLIKLTTAEECEMFFSDPAQVPARLILRGTAYQVTPSPEDPALFFLTKEESPDEDSALQQFLTDVATPLSNLVLMGSMLGRSNIPAGMVPYIDQIRRTADQITRLHYNATAHPASFTLENLPDLIRDTLGYAEYYLPSVPISFRTEGNGDPYILLSKPHIEGLILNLLSEFLSLSDRSTPPPVFSFTLLCRESPCLVVHVEDPSIAPEDVEDLLFAPNPTSTGFLFIRRACAQHDGSMFVRGDGKSGISLTLTLPRKEEFHSSIENFSSSYVGYDQARMLLSNHLELSCYQNVKR